MGRTPLRPAHSASQNGSAPWPTGVTTPRPVMTVRRWGSVMTRLPAGGPTLLPRLPSSLDSGRHQLPRRVAPPQLRLLHAQRRQDGLVHLVDEDVLVEEAQLL